MTRHADEHPAITVRRAAMNLLARREQSFHELTRKLSQKYPDLDRDQIILPALEKLRDEKLQSDRRFVESYVRHRRLRGFGPVRIEAELFQKGVDDNIVRDELYAEEIDWTAQCRQAMEKKFSATPVTSLGDKEKRYRFLHQRGFDGEQIRAVLKES